MNSRLVRFAALTLLCAVSTLTSQAAAPLSQSAQEQSPVLDSDKDKASFIYGLQLGAAFARFGRELDLAELEKSARATLAGKAAPAGASESAALDAFMAYIQKKNGQPSAGISGAPVLSAEQRIQASRLYGRNLAGSIDTLADDLNLEVFFTAYAVSARGGSFKLNLAELSAPAKAYLDGNNDKMLARLCAKNKRIGAAFLAENKTRDGVKSTPSGLQYKVLFEGKGPVPVPPAHVAAHFKAFFVNGLLFHDSHEKGKPAVFALDGCIDGWMEALKMMPEGSVWELYVPSELAYGDRGSPGIPPGTTIVYQLELIKAKIDPDPQAPSAVDGKTAPLPGVPPSPAKPLAPAQK